MYKPDKGETVIVLAETKNTYKWTVGRVMEKNKNSYKIETENPIIQNDAVNVHSEDIHEMTDENYEEYITEINEYEDD